VVEEDPVAAVRGEQGGTARGPVVKRPEPVLRQLKAGDVHRNALYDDSGVIEIVTSGVAGRGAVFGVVRENYAILTFDAEALRVELCSLKVHGRFDLRIPLTKWFLP
jgi:hypothetical protein